MNHYPFFSPFSLFPVPHSLSDKLNLTNYLTKDYPKMGSELFAAAFLPFSLIFVGWGLGVLLLKVQGAEEE
jgi:cytochrome b6-f complex subunit 7